MNNTLNKKSNFLVMYLSLAVIGLFMPFSSSKIMADTTDQLPKLPDYQLLEFSFLPQMPAEPDINAMEYYVTTALPIKFRVKIRNIGTAPTMPNAQWGTYLALNQVLPAPESLDGRTIFKSLLPGEDLTLEGSFTPRQGWSQIAAIIDSRDHERELREDNNVIQKRVIIDYDMPVITAASINRVAYISPTLRTLPSGSVNAYIQLTTHKSAECKYAEIPGIPHNIKTLKLNTSDKLQHNVSIYDFSNGKGMSKEMYVTCKDTPLGVSVTRPEYVIKFKFSPL